VAGFKVTAEGVQATFRNLSATTTEFGKSGNRFRQLATAEGVTLAEQHQRWNVAHLWGQDIALLFRVRVV